MDFANQQAFDDPASRQAAMGANLSEQGAVRDARGELLFRLGTGGMIAPQRAELPAHTPLMRFASHTANVPQAMKGGWWVEQSAFERILRFSQIQDVALIMAARILCGVPPEWSDMRLLVRARLRRPLLAWRGLANTVIVPHPGGGPKVQMLHQNANAERRLHQLFIPGLAALNDPLIFEREDRFSPQDATRGWLYL